MKENYVLEAMDKNTEYDCSGKKILQILHYKIFFCLFQDLLRPVYQHRVVFQCLCQVPVNGNPTQKEFRMEGIVYKYYY
jgi:hypothetical protein